MARRLWLLALALGFVGGIYLVLINRHAAQLRADAQTASRWRPSRDKSHQPTVADLSKLSARANWLIDAQCNKEGGSPFGNRNCYAEAASSMLFEARQQDERRDLAYLGLAVIVALGVATLVVTRRKPAFEA